MNAALVAARGHYQALVAKVDDFFARVHERHRGDMQCDSGCHDCCRVELDVTTVETDAEHLPFEDESFDLVLGHALTAQVSYFVLRKTNEIVFDGSRPPFGGYDQWGRTRADGLELGLTARPTDWLELGQSVTYIDHEQDNDRHGAYLDSGRPRYVATSSATIKPVEGAELTARARYRDGDSSGFGGATDGYIAVDLLGSYRFKEGVELFARVVNLFDDSYQVLYGTNTLGTSVYGGARLGF